MKKSSTTLPLPLLPPQPGCQLCELHLNGQNPGIPTVRLPSSLEPAPANPCVVIVAQNPGFNEDRVNEPLHPTGRSGFFVRDTLCAGTLDDYPPLQDTCTIFLTNVARCLGEKPKSSHYKTCAQNYLYKELDLFRSYFDRPPVLFSLGRPAAAFCWQYLSKEKTSQATASLVKKNGTLLNGFHFVSTFHPAAMFREHSYFESIVNHTRLVFDIIHGNLAPVTLPHIVSPFPPTNHKYFPYEPPIKG